MELTVQELAERIGGTVEGDGALRLSALAAIQLAEPGAVSFLANKRYARYLATTRASAVIVSETQSTGREDLTVIRMKDPYYGFLQTLKLFYGDIPAPEAGVHTTAYVDATAEVDPAATVGALAFIGPGAQVGAGTVIGAGCVVTERVRIGADCLIHPNVTILARATVGDRVIIHAGAVIGSDGFGFVPKEGAYEKIPQVGSVRIESDVEIGANCAIDRGTIGDTVIGAGSKLDNLIQIAHNVEIGRNTAIAAQSGISGSTRLGESVIIAGQVGLVGHIDVGDRVTVTAQSGVSKSISGEGKIYRGSPAREMHEELRQEAALRQLPEIIDAVRRLEKRLASLEKEALEESRNPSIPSGQASEE